MSNIIWSIADQGNDYGHESRWYVQQHRNSDEAAAGTFGSLREACNFIANHSPAGGRVSIPAEAATTLERVIPLAQSLLSDDGENVEYDRALVELVNDLSGVNNKGAVAMILGATGRSLDQFWGQS